MDLQALKVNWDALGRQDPLRSILGYGGREQEWDRNEFFATGEQEVADVLDEAAPFGVPSRRERALDFGCGVGRITQALAAHFDAVDGVDIAPSMVELARKLNRQGERCRYHLNEADSLGAFGDGSFDLVYSVLVLQHMQPEYALRYLDELARVLRAGGLLVVQVPSGRDVLPRLARSAVLAEIEPHVPSLTLAAGERANVGATIRNAGDAVWPCRPGIRMINVGNHWRTGDGELLFLDDAREALPRDVAPGEAVDVELRVTAPPDPGEYVLELDLVQEDVDWFARRRKLSRRRSQPARIPVHVTDEIPRAAGDDELEPRMEMYAVPREEVLGILERRGVRVLRIDRNDAAGPGWVSVRYLATR